MNLIKIQDVHLTPETEKQFEDLVLPKGELFREVVLDLIPMIHDRIHQKGLAADGTEIGVYSDSYMKVRTGNYGNSDKISRGANKGKSKNAGTATRGSSKGTSRAQYHRDSDTSVILSLTRQMENDYAVMPGELGWGIGFNNSHNFDKANWNDERYGKKVYDLTEEELDHAIKLTEELITERFK